MEIIDQKILHDSVRWPLSPEYGGDPLFNNTRKKKDTVAGDIVVANSAGDKQFVPLSLYAEDKTKWAEKGYEPIAVVVVPASHTDDGTARCMSLKYMSVSTPETGRDFKEDMYYGSNNKGSIVNKAATVSGLEVYIPGTTSYSSTGMWTIPSDNEKWLQPDVDNPLNPDPIAKKLRTVFGNSGGTWVASPYGADGISKNENYFRYGSIGEYMNGKEDTQYIWEAGSKSVANGPDIYQELLNYSSEPDYYPAIYACCLYHTTGTSQGDWYMPSIGEAWYVMPRSNEIRTALLELGISDSYLGLGYITWSLSFHTSTQKDTAYEWTCNTSGGLISAQGRSSTAVTIAFIKI